MRTDPIWQTALVPVQAQSERMRAQLAIDAAGVGVWERDLQGRVLHWNDAMYRLRGFDPANAPSPDELMDRLTHPEDRAALQGVYLQHIASGQPYRQELRVRGPDGQWTWLLTQGLVMRDEQGQAVGMAGVNLDITERKRAAELALEKQRIEQASRDKSAFMARMSHELRTPMNAVLGFARLLDGDADEPPTPRQRERLAHISTAGKALMVLIDDLLDTARREAPPASAPKAGALQVLCVEDNPVNLQLVRELLAMRPAVRLRTAEDGASGLAAAQAEPPDLLLLDVQLPDINGLDVMRRLRAQPALDQCRIVALSADAMPEHIAAALAAGFDDYWTKPIQFDRFLAGIDELAQGASRSRIQPTPG